MSTELITEKQFKEVITNGSEILRTSELRVSKAVSVGEKIVSEIYANGMSQELDERCNKYLVNCRNAKNEIENERKPITAYFDAVRKEFTYLEGQLDPKKADAIPAKIQAHRDAYVKKLRDEEAKKQALAQVKLDKDNEIINIKSSLETQLSEYVQNHILERKQKLQNSFNNITLENYEEKSKELKVLVVAYDKAHFDSFSPNYQRKHTTQEETIVILNEFMNSKDFNLISAVVVGDLQKFKAELIEKLPSLKTSLQEMAKAGEEEQKRLADEKAKREADAEAKMKADAEAEKERAAKEAEINKVAEQTNAMMDNMVLTESVAPETRDGFQITLLNKTAVAEIFTFWFQREGMTLTVPELEKKTIAQMKSYCEKVGHKSGDMIVSDNLKYEPVYKAVNRK
jgi:hypothetical protein